MCLQWKDEIPHLTLLTIVLTLIYVNGCCLAYDQLLRQLRPLGISGEESHPEFGKLEHLIAAWVKMGYLEPEKQHLQDSVTYDYHWGPRAKTEFSEDRIIQFVKAIYNEQAEDFNEKLERDLKQISGTATALNN